MHDHTATLFALIAERLVVAAPATTDEARALLDAAAAHLNRSQAARVLTCTRAAAVWIAADEPVHIVRKLAQALAIFGGPTEDRATALADEAHAVLIDMGSLPR